ncbi:regulator of cell morphogenesis and NO signaling [Metabacillus crassostreae]|uniref:iron-sulfur cluster repair di-iron protein n=1 Tax=Metabacillus crassostreae TaxID=929098 RepID=UPI00195DED87|nr:iron-sulfur cluster repair di-iron protein [Metabacillus crassostreae]MBM7605546.1 regulator of cell morphogenesis and NO signaling [Metabacillus crassostreae]
MAHMFNESSNVGEVVRTFPKASDFFKSYRIDFCCGGNRQLIEAILERNLPAQQLITELNELYEESKNQIIIDWEIASNRELIDHIVSKHHRYLNEELPTLSPYVTKVARVHGGTQPHLAKLYQLFNELKNDLVTHLMKEESEDFPLILKLEESPSDQLIEEFSIKMRELVNEHNHAGDLMKEMREITNDFTPPENACGTYRVVYQRLEALENDLFDHIHLENNVLFPRVAAAVGVSI